MSNEMRRRTWRWGVVHIQDPPLNLTTLWMYVCTCKIHSMIMMVIYFNSSVLLSLVRYNMFANLHDSYGLKWLVYLSAGTCKFAQFLAFWVEITHSLCLLVFVVVDKYCCWKYTKVLIFSCCCCYLIFCWWLLNAANTNISLKFYVGTKDRKMYINISLWYKIFSALNENKIFNVGSIWSERNW